MRTTIIVPWKIRVRNSLIENTRLKVMRLIGLFLNQTKNYSLKVELRGGGFRDQCVDIHNRWSLWGANQDRPRLTQENLDQIKEYYDKQNDDIWKARTEEKGGMAWNLVELVEPILKKGEVRSVVNIGGQVDRISSHLAGEFQEVKFTSVDFSEHLEEWNSALPQHDNWEFVSGYALDLLEKGVLEGDVVMMTSTSVMFTNPELRSYLSAMGSTKYVIFNEGWWPINWRIRKPESLRTERSIRSGYYANYHHNYPRILEEEGFDTINSRIIPVSNRNYYALQVIGKRRS